TYFVYFFQAEDGIRDFHVTGVQTCALPIFYMFYYTRFFADWNTGKTNLELFTFGYLVVTFAELCLSPIGLSIVTKLSPQRLGGRSEERRVGKECRARWAQCQ